MTKSIKIAYELAEKQRKDIKKFPLIFTLVELLVVIAIIALLSALLLPALAKAKDTGKKIACVNRFKQVGAAIHLYAGDYNDFLAAAPEFKWAWPLRSYVGMKDADFIFEIPNNDRSSNVFYCPSSNFYETPDPIISKQYYLSYAPTLCAVAYPPTLWGGYIYSYYDQSNTPRGGTLIPKPFRRVPTNSALAIEARRNTWGRAGQGCFLKPENAKPWVYAATSPYSPDFCHGKSFNALFADAHVESIHFGIYCDENWIKQ